MKNVRNGINKSKYEINLKFLIAVKENRLSVAKKNVAMQCLFIAQ